MNAAVIRAKTPRKKYPRPTTVRFDTEEAQIILEAIQLSVIQLKEKGFPGEKIVKILHRLEHRIDTEETRKKDHEELSQWLDESKT